MVALTTAASKYLLECLESQWDQDSEYLPSRNEKLMAWRAQNEVRAMTGLDTLSREDLEGAYGDKLTRETP
jgi:hypothetical protein